MMSRTLQTIIAFTVNMTKKSCQGCEDVSIQMILKSLKRLNPLTQ